MKNVLIIKTGAAGDVLRTTFVLETLASQYNVYWLTDSICIPLINDTLATIVTSFDDLLNIEFETVYSLEEEVSLLLNLQHIQYKNIVGCYIVNDTVTYSAPNEKWFDISLVSKFGIEDANKLKYYNTATFQEMLSGVFNIEWSGQRYNKLIYNASDSITSGDIAIAPTAGNKWPNKNWAYYNELINILQAQSYIVNVLPTRNSIKEHIADIASHKLVICGDSLPMHIATALHMPSIALFTCTSAEEIYDYNLIHKVISTDLNRYYYQRNYDQNCTTSISVPEVISKFKQIVL